LRGCDGSGTTDAGYGRGQRPVINVSWHQARSYASWLSRVTGAHYRLLTEAEWEYAARGETTAVSTHPKYPWGNAASRDHANYGAIECCQGAVGGRDQWFTTAPTGQFPPNPFGLHDMHGNVFEWVEDIWHPNYQNNPPSDGAEWSEGGDPALRVERGGSWDYPPSLSRSAYRGADSPDLRGYNVGFRVARTLLPPTP
jgi:formylglycine-generating enzyme required for sulfatase activity